MQSTFHQESEETTKVIYLRGENYTLNLTHVGTETDRKCMVEEKEDAILVVMNGGSKEISQFEEFLESKRSQMPSITLKRKPILILNLNLHDKSL